MSENSNAGWQAFERLSEAVVLAAVSAGIRVPPHASSVEKHTYAALESLAALTSARAEPDMVPPATSRDRWMYEQGRLAERDPRTPGTRAELIEECCARIKAADDAMADRDYMLDSDDCIKVLRGTWTAPLANDCPPKASTLAASPAQTPQAAGAIDARGAGGGYADAAGLWAAHGI